MTTSPFHGKGGLPDREDIPSRLNVLRTTAPQFVWQTHQHDQVDVLIERLHAKGLGGLFDSDTLAVDGKQVPPALYDPDYFESTFEPAERRAGPWPKRELALTLGHEAYALYNWELFFHLPMLVAAHLSKAQRFREALSWMRFVLDPSDNSAGEAPARFWKFLPFKTMPNVGIDSLLTLLSQTTDPGTPEDAERQALLESIQAWKRDPFRPHTVAEFRPAAYMRKAVMQTLDILIAAGDALFKEDTGESIDEATLYYVTAANILGSRPQKVPHTTDRMPQTYDSLRQRLDEFSNALTEIESHFAFDVSPLPESAESGQVGRGLQTSGSLYFCVPGNEKLLGYWDAVADRLFKIRNSLNFKGTFRQLALYEPPLDPGLLARAKAMNVSLGDAMSSDALLMPVRYQVLAQKANELCQEVRSLGNALQAAIERADGERMEAIRTGHAKQLNKLAEITRYGQWQEAIRAREAIEIGLESQRGVLTYLEQELGIKDAGGSWPEFEDLDEAALTRLRLGVDRMRFTPPPPPVVRVADNLSGSGGYPISPREALELSLRTKSQLIQKVLGSLETGANVADKVPTLQPLFAPFGTGTEVKLNSLGMLVRSAAAVIKVAENEVEVIAGNLSRTNSFDRRATDWHLRRHSAVYEAAQSIKQLLAAQIRESVARREFESQQLQSQQTEELLRFLNAEGTAPDGKIANASFYLWLKSELLSLHQRAYELALDTARKAESALRYELGDRAATYVSAQKLEGREALTAGDKLQLDLKRMELAYLELNTRELELTKHVSLRQLQPEELLKLRMTGECDLEIPEALFDLEGPGHYFRRIKYVGVSVACVIGPYASINCQLQLTGSRVRTKPDDLAHGYAEQPDDTRFTVFHAVVTETVASGAQADTGLFETNLRDERYLPFEGAGAISRWHLRLPGAPSEEEKQLPRQFDYSTISDLVLHIRYTARSSEPLRQAVIKHYAQHLEAINGAGAKRLFSLRYEFPTLWAQLTRTDGPHKVDVRLGNEHLPYWWSHGASKGRFLSGIWVAVGGQPDAGSKVWVNGTAVSSHTVHIDTSEGDSDMLIQYPIDQLPVSNPASGSIDFEVGCDVGGMSDLLFVIELPGET